MGNEVLEMFSIRTGIIKSPLSLILSATANSFRVPFLEIEISEITKMNLALWVRIVFSTSSQKSSRPLVVPNHTKHCNLADLALKQANRRNNCPLA